MKPKKAFLGLILLILAGTITIVYLYSPLVYCILVPWSDFKRVASGLYVAPDMSETQIQELKTAIVNAKSRVAGLYWGCKVEPVIIAGDKPSDGGRRCGKYGVTRGGTGISHILVVGSYIVLGPNGINPDVIAHELTHCELARRVGIFRLGKFPSWFIEGLAMQLDNRPNYEETEWVKLTHNGEISMPLEQIDTPPEFYNQAAFFHYIVAKHEVKEWLAASKT
ncbi:MAG TPA: hypothetical protein VHY08_10365, partial [Bacillota bacterium]|nr:hypothetical protein [Bacillota bacterium]